MCHLTYAGYRFPPGVISYAVWLYYRFPLSLRMVEELLAARGIDLTYETVRRWSVKFGLGIARRIRSTALAQGDKWHLDEVVVTINVSVVPAPWLTATDECCAARGDRLAEAAPSGSKATVCRYD